MSIQNTEFSGDVAVGRNLRAGGKMDVQGSVTVHHNLIVKGWLDAVNIKGPNKGIFLNVSDLREAYPTPHDGWFAGVGASTPFDAYIGSGGDWVATGGTIEVTVDMTEYTEGVEALQEDIDAVAQTVNGHTSVINNHTQQLTQLGTSLNNVSTTANNAQSLAKLALAYPTVQFKGILESVDRISSEKAPVTIADIALGDKIYYVEASRCFVAEVDGTYYRRWNSDGELAYMDSGLSNILPNKLYVCRATGVPYWCDGNYSLKPIEVDLSSINTSIRNLQDAVRTAQAAAETAQSRADNAYSLAGAAGTYAKRAHSIPTAFFNTMMDTSELVVEDGECPTEIALGELRDAIVYSVNAYRFYCLYEGVLYTKWNEGAELAYQDVDGVIRNKLYADKEGVLYYALATNGKLLPAKIAFETIKDDVQTMIDDAANELDNTFRSLMAPRLFVNANKLFPSVATFSDVNNLLTQIETLPSAQQALYKVPGVVFTMKTADGWQSWQFVGSSVSGENPDWTNGTMWKKFGGEGGAAGIFNVTNEIPPVGGYYVLFDDENTSLSAVHAVWNAEKAASGLIISFEIGSGLWKTYQYIGKTVTETNWLTAENWQDFGSLAAGSETYIIIDNLIPDSPVGGAYNLQSAITALMSYQHRIGVTYAKKGLIIAYRTGENTMETKQFQGDSAQDVYFGDTDYWKDFGGGGGSDIETTDTPESGSTAALTAGGAYDYVPRGLAVDTDTEGVVKMKMVNAAGEDVGDEVQFTVGTGSGGGSGTVIAVNFENNPMYGKAGGDFKVKAAIMSITKAGNQETSNSIASVSFINRTTRNTVASFRPRQASSATMTTYSFEFDLSSLGQSAGEVPLQAIVTDDGGNTATKNITLIAIDVTCESVQTLNYTSQTTLKVGGPSLSIPMYRFPNNASDHGIRTKIEMYRDSEWVTLQEVVINDSKPHNVTIDPTGLGHGAYPLRIQGTDVASGTKGNVLHTAVMVIEQREEVADYDKPILVARWSDDTDGKVKLFETIRIDMACFQRSSYNPTVEVSVTNQTTGASEVVATRMMSRGNYYTVEKRIVAYNDGDQIVFDAECGDTTLSESRELQIEGSLLDIAETEGAYYKISLAGRSNTDADKSIRVNNTDGEEVRIDVHGSNYSTNGFVPDTFGTEQTGGRMSLRVAENVTAECTDKPFRSSAIVQNGFALSLTFKVKNIANRNARIIRCMGERLGFVLTGEKFYVTTNGDSEEALKSVFTTAASSYLDDVVYRYDIVIEPQSRAPYGGVMLCKVYQNGDMSACVPIDTSTSFPTFEDVIHFDGTDADLYLYEIVRWNTYYDFIQAFNNYIVNITDTQAMLTEYESNKVMSDVTAEGTTKPRPDMQKLLDRGVMVCAITRTSDSNLSPDGSPVTDSPIYYPDYIENIKDKKTTVIVDWHLYFPDRPWANVVVEAVPETNQGTSTLAYPVKNKKAKFKKAKRIRMMYTREEISQMYNGDETVLAMYDDAAALAAKKKIRIREGSTPINTITIKVDYSDSAGANNCALMEQMNDVQLALGTNYITPAQRFNTDSSETLHTSIDGITCALFRTDYRIGQERGVEAATLPENAYFHSKANFNADKGNPHFFGFEDVKGYNKGCVNYGEFKEIVTPRGTDIDAYKATVLSNTSVLVPGTLYMISEFCGPETRFIENDGTGSMVETAAVSDYTAVEKTAAELLADDVSNYDWATVYRTSDLRFFKYEGGVWRDTTGSMTYDQTTGKWVIVGRVLNPVECFEYRQYQEFCWQQGVNSVDDMLVTLHTDDGDVPIWTTYYESRYPDDDDLNDLYAQGKKVPYQLYRELAFCQQCNQNLTDDAAENGAVDDQGHELIFNGAGASTTITLDGVTVPGTKANRLLKWQHEMHHIFSPYSNNCYIVASDYKATVDQRAKNMMIAAYKETDGSIRFYFNHWYDGDSVDEADNDCYLTIPWDMDGRSSHLYQGWDGVMFQQTYALFERGEGVWIDDNGTMLTLHDTAAAMRSTRTSTGLEIFSADGCYRYWMTNRILKWPKVVSSFDGERKYIETATASDNHYPALHGLRLDSLPAFQRRRFAYRDGYYQTGDLFNHFFQARVMGSIEVKITAAQDGYFGMGVDSTSSAKYSCYLRAGESHTFTEAPTGVGGKLIYIFGADKLSELDLSGCTPKNSNWMIGDCKLLRKLVIGGESYNPTYTDDILSGLNLGRMPFMEEVDIRNTKVLTLNVSGCPRMKKVLAEGSLLQSFTPCESSPLDTLTLPASMTELQLVNLPKLTYPNGGMSVASFANVTRVQLSGCQKIDNVGLLTDILMSGARVAEVSLEEGSTSGTSYVLETMQTLGTKGIGSELTNVCEGLRGVWMLTSYIDETILSSLQAYYPLLTIHQAQYTMMVQDDTTSERSNVTNLDNNTGYGTDTAYAPSGHISKILEKRQPVLMSKTGNTLNCIRLSKSDYKKLADGTTFNINKYLNDGYDAFMLEAHYWRKGINDFKNQLKYTAWSSLDSEPLSTATTVRRALVSTLPVQEGIVLNVTGITEGESTLESSGVLQTRTGFNTYHFNVRGMKQVRWPGMNSQYFGACFLNEEGVIIGKFNMNINDNEFDFDENIGDYLFTGVPSGAVDFVFTSKNTNGSCEAIAVDSNEVEAIEPDWVEVKPYFGAIYEISIDNSMQPRSMTSQTVRAGTGTATTWNGWKYNADGTLNTDLNNGGNVPTTSDTLNYTCKDFQNLAYMRGEGYQLFDYEMSKDVALMTFGKVGDRDGQRKFGTGKSAGGSTGYLDSIGAGDSNYSSGGGNKVLGYESFMACTYEWMDRVMVNVVSYKRALANHMESASGDPTDAVWHIYDPVADTERTVQGLTVSGQTVARTRHGRHCDIIASKFTGESNFASHYADGQYYTHSTCRVVGRSYYHANSNGGLAFANANYASSLSITSLGSRLAFRPPVGTTIIFEDDENE